MPDGMNDSGLQFCVLGPLEARLDGRRLELGGPRQRALLALLLLEPGLPVSAAKLADELWRGQPPPSAETTLRSYVSRLRRSVGAQTLVSEAAGYRLAVPADALDSHRFEELLREGREALARGSASFAVERLQSALALWRGPAFADVGEHGALANEARRLDELRLVCVEERIEADLALGRHDTVVPELRALVAQEPLRERLWRLLVLALYRSQRQAEALAAYREAHRLLDEELGLEPGEELRQLEAAILRHEVEAPAPTTRAELPHDATTFVGRADELAELEDLLRDRRLVTVTGLGGTGKTRLALEVARHSAHARGGNVWFVELTAIADGALVVPAVASSIGIDTATVDAVVERLRPLDALLVLDNCEHVVDACALLVADLLRSCPNLRMLATSRVSLGTPGETDFALAPLPTDAAVRLFLDRAAALRRDFSGDETTIAAICRELDGLPLAIELAAARAKALSPSEIAARLDDRFRFLRAWHRVADPRHRTLQTTMDWSYDLLGPGEQELLRRLSVFAGGAELAAIAEVCRSGDEVAALDELERLVDASLVRAEHGEPTRYRLLETVRQYATAKLADDPDASEVRRRHAEHYLRLAEASNLGLPSFGAGAQQPRQVLREQHNLRAALDWAAEADVEVAVRLMLALENFWVTHAVVEGRDRYARLLPRATALDVVLRARATLDYASCLDVLQEHVSSRAVLEQSRALFEEAGDESGVANVDYRLGIAGMHLANDVDSARRLWRSSLDTFRRLGDATGELQILGDLGWLEIRFGDADRGRAMARESVESARRLGWHWWVAQHCLKQAAFAADEGLTDEAEALAREGLPVALQMEHRQFVVYALAVLARTAAARGADERALALWASVDAVEDAPGRFGRFDRAAYASELPDGPLPEPLPLPQAVTLALSD
jgi:predicted ATPase/DNA-binding SARP family transcriptional activator